MINPRTFFFLSVFFIKLIYAQWIELNTGISSPLESISAVDDNVCWSAGGNFVIRTTNGGADWTSSIPNNQLTIYNIFGVDALTALCAGTNAGTAFIYRTSSGGSNWSMVFAQPNGFINSLWMTSNSNGFMMGDPVSGRWSLWRTSNGGISWDSTSLYLQQSGNEYSFVNDMMVLGNYIWFQSFGVRIYNSSNNGNSWNFQSGPEVTNGGSVWFNSLTNGMCSGVGGIYATTNGGQTWNIKTHPDYPNNLSIFGKGSVYFGATFNTPSRIYITSTQGNNWSIDYTPANGQISHATSSRNGNSGWACKTNGGVIRKGNLIGLQIISSNIPTEFSLYQNYPNPFNPVTKIRFAVPSNLKGATPNVKLMVYDLLGNEVAVLVNEELTPGVYKVEFDGSNLASGVYYYRLAAGDFTDSKKMVLMK